MQGLQDMAHKHSALDTMRLSRTRRATTCVHWEYNNKLGSDGGTEDSERDCAGLQQVTARMPAYLRTLIKD